MQVKYLDSPSISLIFVLSPIGTQFNKQKITVNKFGGNN